MISCQYQMLNVAVTSFFVFIFFLVSILAPAGRICLRGSSIFIYLRPWRPKITLVSMHAGVCELNIDVFTVYWEGGEFLNLRKWLKKRISLWPEKEIIEWQMPLLSVWTDISFVLYHEAQRSCHTVVTVSQIFESILPWNLGAFQMITPMIAHLRISQY